MVKGENICNDKVVVNFIWKFSKSCFIVDVKVDNFYRNYILYVENFWMILNLVDWLSIRFIVVFKLFRIMVMYVMLEKNGLKIYIVVRGNLILDIFVS